MRGERGAVLVQVAVSVLVLCGFCGLVIDYGVFWVARAQAQNAADAGAHAGATALAFDSIQDPSYAEGAALSTSQSNDVWGPEGITEVTAYPGTPPCLVPGAAEPPGGGLNIPNCIKVDVYRDPAHGNPLPTFFARLFGVNEQGVHAQAKGAAAGANTTHCLAPIAIPDKWSGPLSGPLAWRLNPPSSFVEYVPNDPDHTLASPRNTYTAPVATGGAVGSYGTGYRLDDNYLTVSPEVVLDLTQFTPADFTHFDVNFGITTNQFVAVDVGGDFQTSLASCNGTKWQIGDDLPLDYSANINQATGAAQTRYAAQDSGARWDPFLLRVTSDKGLSPRLIVVPLFDVDDFESHRTGAAGTLGVPRIRIVNFAGFFIDPAGGSVSTSSIRGRLTTYPGSIDISKPQVPYLSAFLRTGVLFR